MLAATAAESQTLWKWKWFTVSELFFNLTKITIVSILRQLGLSAIFLFAIVSCKTIVVQAPSEKEDPIAGLVFLTFVMHPDSTSGNMIDLVGKTIVRQKLKSDPLNSSAPNKVWVSQLTASGKKLSSVALDHPLFKRVEFANDQGQFESREITLKDAEFFARVTLFAETEYIQLEEELSGRIVYTVKFKMRD